MSVGRGVVSDGLGFLGALAVVDSSCFRFFVVADGILRVGVVSVSDQPSMSEARRDVEGAANLLSYR